MEVLYENGWYLNDPHFDGQPVLGQPKALKGDRSIWMWLLEHGANPNIRLGHRFGTPFEVAVVMPGDNIAILKDMIEYGAMVSESNALFNAVYANSQGVEKVVDLLLDQRGALDTPESGIVRLERQIKLSNMLLHEVLQGNDKLIELFLDRGAYSLFRGGSGLMELELAQRYGRTEILRMLGG